MTRDERDSGGRDEDFSPVDAVETRLVLGSVLAVDAVSFELLRLAHTLVLHMTWVLVLVTGPHEAFVETNVPTLSVGSGGVGVAVNGQWSPFLLFGGVLDR